MSWSAEDIKNWKKIFEEKHGKKIRSERAISPLLVNWIKNRHPKSKVAIGGMQGHPLLDVVEMNERGELIGYEVKMAHIELRESARTPQTTKIIQGIGQAIEYLYWGVDYSYLVAPDIISLSHLSYVLEKTTPLGLIFFDRTFNFKEV